MPKTKISEFSATPGNNTDIDGINIAEGCAPSGINDAIRELMAQLKDFQAGTAGDSFNGPVGTTTAAAGAFTTLSASSTVSGTGFSTYLASPPAIGGTTAAAGSFTTLSASGNITVSGGTANGVAYLNGSKVMTTGSALTFDGTNFTAPRTQITTAGSPPASGAGLEIIGGTSPLLFAYNRGTSAYLPLNATASAFGWALSGSDAMTLTSTGLGIGTSSPAAKLDVNSTGAVVLRLTRNGGTATNTGVQYFNGSNSWYAGMSAGGLYAVGYNDANLDVGQLRLDSAGNLGLGVTPSAWNSSFRAMQLGNSGYLFGRSSQTQMEMGNNAVFDATDTRWEYITTNTAQRYLQDATSGSHQWFTAASGTAGNAISFTQAMTLDASGNLGVGTTSPSTRLHAKGTGGTIATFERDASGTIAYFNRNTGSGNVGAIIGADSVAGYFAGGNSTNNMVYLDSVNNLAQFYTNGSERARIDSSGNLLVGKTATSYTTNGGEIRANGQINSALATGLDFWNSYSTSAGAYRFYVTNGGTIFATSTTISAISDIRFKENVRDLDVGLDAVMALKPRVYDWKEGKGANIKNARGFIAQEFEQVFPDLIDEWKDPAPEGEEPYKSVRADLIPVLVKAIQEQQALITQLQADVAALKGN